MLNPCKNDIIEERTKIWRITCLILNLTTQKFLGKFVAPHEVDYMQAQVTAADELIRKGTGAGSDFLRTFTKKTTTAKEPHLEEAAEQIKAGQRCFRSLSVSVDHTRCEKQY